MLSLIEIVSAGVSLPDGTDSFGLRVCRADGSSRHDFVWPTSGPVRAAGPLLAHRNACPAAVGDGICLATEWTGVSSGSLPAELFLLAAYRLGDLLSRSWSAAKVRVAEAVVVRSWTALAFAEQFSGHLSGAYLDSADLHGANLSGADLSGANLRGADLSSANLSGADLYSADLFLADLTGADLSDADLTGAKLSGADLSNANLSGANLAAVNWSAASQFKRIH